MAADFSGPWFGRSEDSRADWESNPSPFSPSSPLNQLPWNQPASPRRLEPLDPEISSQLAAWRENRARRVSPIDTDIWSRIRDRL